MYLNILLFINKINRFNLKINIYLLLLVLFFKIKYKLQFCELKYEYF